MTDPILLTADDVRKRLDYDPMTGVFLWRWRDDVPNAWNTRHAGTVAGFDTNGYRQIGINGVMHFAHRLAWLIVTGEWPDAEIDHVNGAKNDNRIANLRRVIHGENMRNKAAYANNKSGHMGVWWDKSRGKWLAHIRVDGRLISLGRFTDKSAAMAARRAAEIAHGFHPNHGRIAPMSKTS